MASIHVGELAPAGCWDSNLLHRLFDGTLYHHGLEFKRVDGYPNTNDVVVLICPGRYWFEHVLEINKAIRRYKGVLFIRTADEEDMLDIAAVVHPNARFWVQTPRTDRTYGDARLFGVGFPPHFNDLPIDPPDKATDVFLSAQRTHIRREEAFDALKHTPGSLVEATAGFTQGMGPAEYAKQMCGAKIAPCPSGAVSPDSFRFWEALEAHTVPIADDVSPKYLDEEAPYFSEGFWGSMFEGNLPFPVLTNYADLPGYVSDVLSGWPANANRVAAWWMRYKREMTLWLETDLKALGAL